LFLFFCFFAVGFALYANTLGHGFVLDDVALVVDNSYIKNFTLTPRLFLENTYRFSSSRSSNYYRPLQLVSYAFDYHFWKLNPAFYHGMNILLHAINSFLVSLLLLRLFSSYRLALFAGLLFCVHPIHVSVVAYVAGRADLLVAFFTLLSLIKFYDYVKDGKGGAFAQSLIFFGAALLCRENALLLPLFAMLLAFACGARKERAWVALGAFLVLIVFYVRLRFQLFHGIAFLRPHTRLFPFSLEMVNVARILREYIALFVFPWPLYPMRTVPFIEKAALGSVLEALCLFGFFGFSLVWSFIKKERALLLGILWFLCGFLPLIRMMYLFPRLGAVAAENWMYGPSIGVFLVLGSFCARNRRWPQALFILLLFYFSALTVDNGKYWKDSMTLYPHTLKWAPRNTHVRFNLAAAYFEKGLYDQARRELEIITRMEPESWDVYLNFGNLYYAQDALEPAFSFYEKALRLNPRCSLAYYNEGLVRAKQSRDEEARPLFLKALEIDRDFGPAYAALGDWYLRNGFAREALRTYEQAYRLNPDDTIRSRIRMITQRLKDL
jgi:tetratricopeptide (TPR) repeat protein